MSNLDQGLEILQEKFHQPTLNSKRETELRQYIGMTFVMQGGLQRKEALLTHKYTYNATITDIGSSTQVRNLDGTRGFVKCLYFRVKAVNTTTQEPSSFSILFDATPDSKKYLTHQAFSDDKDEEAVIIFTEVDMLEKIDRALHSIESPGLYER